MTEERQVTIARDSGVQQATVALEPTAEGCRLELRLADGRNLVADGGDYFDCLVTVRRTLELEGATLFCQGARRDVWPSGMARSMGAGLKAYVLVNGRTPTMDDLVDIFNAAEPGDVGTVAEQERTRDDWLASRGIKS